MNTYHGLDSNEGKMCQLQMSTLQRRTKRNEEALWLRQERLKDRRVFLQVLVAPGQPLFLINHPPPFREQHHFYIFDYDFVDVYEIMSSLLILFKNNSKKEKLPK